MTEKSAVVSMEQFLEEELEIPAVKYEYLDHTADVQLHSWGDTMPEAFEQCAMAMFGYMTNLCDVEVLEKVEIEAEGDDLEGLLYHFLDELLFMFSAEPFLIAKKVKITEFDIDKFHIKATAYGEPFDLAKHKQGTEVKAITYSAMQIVDRPKVPCPELFVIIDI